MLFSLCLSFFFNECIICLPPCVSRRCVQGPPVHVGPYRLAISGLLFQLANEQAASTWHGFIWLSRSRRSRVKRAPTVRNLPFINNQKAAHDVATHWDEAIPWHKMGGWARAKRLDWSRDHSEWLVHFWGPSCFQRLQIHFDFSINTSQPLVTECCHSVESIQEVVRVRHSEECGGFDKWIINRSYFKDSMGKYWN